MDDNDSLAKINAHIAKLKRELFPIPVSARQNVIDKLRSEAEATGHPVSAEEQKVLEEFVRTGAGLSNKLCN